MLSIRLADKADLTAVTALYHEVSDAMIGMPFDCCWRVGVHPSDELIERFVRDGSMLVALDDQEIVAAVGLDHDLGKEYGEFPWLVKADEDEVAVMHILTTRPGWRGRGVSRELLRASLDEARRRGMKTARLDVTVNNAPAIALYRSEGFVRIGCQAQEIGPDDDPFVVLDVMELPL